MSGAELAALRRTLLEVALREHQALGPALAAAREAFAWVAGDAHERPPVGEPASQPPGTDEPPVRAEQPVADVAKPGRKPRASKPAWSLAADLQERVMVEVAANPGITPPSLSAKIGAPLEQLHRACEELRGAGRLVSVAAETAGIWPRLYTAVDAPPFALLAPGEEERSGQAVSAGGEQQDRESEAEPVGAMPQRDEQQDAGDRAQGAAEDEETPGDREDRVLAQVRAAPGSNINQLSDKLVLHPDTVRLILRTLERDGKVRSQPSAKGKLYAPVLSDDEAAAEADAAERARQAKLRLPAGGVRAKIGG